MLAQGIEQGVPVIFGIAVDEGGIFTGPCKPDIPASVMVYPQEVIADFMLQPVMNIYARRCGDALSAAGRGRLSTFYSSSMYERSSIRASISRRSFFVGRPLPRSLDMKIVSRGGWSLSSSD